MSVPSLCGLQSANEFYLTCGCPNHLGKKQEHERKLFCFPLILVYPGGVNNSSVEIRINTILFDHIATYIRKCNQ